MQTSSYKSAAATAIALSALLALGACGKKEDTATMPSTPAATTPAPVTTPPADTGSMSSTMTPTSSMGSGSMMTPTNTMGGTNSSTMANPNGSPPSVAASAGGTQ